MRQFAFIVCLLFAICVNAQKIKGMGENKTAREEVANRNDKLGRKLFLASSFKDVAKFFVDFAGGDLEGKKVTFIPTASIPESVKFFVSSGRKTLEKLGLTVDELELTQASEQEIRDKLEKNDYIYITGGNTFFLLQELRKTGADEIIVEQIEQGKLYIGESAGSIIMSPNIEYVKEMDDCRKAPELPYFSALHVIDFYPLPHHTNFPFKKVVEKIIAAYGERIVLYPISNTQVITVNGTEVRVEGRR